jgi:hypothetical protein
MGWVEQELLGTELKMGPNQVRRTPAAVEALEVQEASPWKGE